MAKANQAATIEKPVAQIDFSEYMGEEYEGVSTSYAHIQVLNDKSIDNAGLFITQENADATGFEPSPSWMSHSHTFESGAVATGYRCITPRMVVVRQGPLLMGFSEGKPNTRLYNGDTYDKDTMSASRKFLLFLVDDDNQPMHRVPLQFTAKGTFSKGFSEAYKAMQTTANSAFGQLTKSYKSRGDKFFAMCVLSLSLNVANKGVAPKSKWCANIESSGKITATNFSEFWVGQDTATKELVQSTYDSTEGFGEPYSAQPAASTQAITNGDETEYEYEWTEEETPIGLAGAPGFSKIITTLEAATSIEQLDKRIAWALAPTQANAFTDYSEYTSVITQKGEAVKVGLTKADFDEIPF